MISASSTMIVPSSSMSFQKEMYQEVMSSVTGRNFNATIMIMLQTVEPYDVAVLFWSPDDLANGKYKYRYALSIVKDCFDKKWFPGYDAKSRRRS